MTDLVHAAMSSDDGATGLGIAGSATVASLIARWGYAAVALGVFFEGETIVLVAGAMAHRGLLSLPAVVAAAFAGSLLGDQLWFHLGHRYGRRFVARRAAWQSRSARAEALLARFGTAFVIAFRFVYGFRTITPVVLGSTGYAAARFAILNAIGAALWATTFSLTGYAFGVGLVHVLGRATRLEEAILATVAVGVLLWIVSRVASVRHPRPRTP